MYEKLFLSYRCSFFLRVGFMEFTTNAMIMELTHPKTNSI